MIMLKIFYFALLKIRKIIFKTIVFFKISKFFSFIIYIKSSYYYFKLFIKFKAINFLYYNLSY